MPKVEDVIGDEARAKVDGMLLRTRLAENATVHERVLQILSELPAIGKSQRNEQQKFMYRGHDDVLNALNPLLAEHGVFMVPWVRDRVTEQRTTAKGTIMYEVNLLVEYTFYGPGGDSFSASAWGEGTDMGDKSTNKAMTMAFKNVIAQVFAISTAENASADTDSGSPEETVRPFDPGVNLLDGAIRGESAGQRIGEALRAIDSTVDWGQTLSPVLTVVFGVESSEQIPEARYPEFLCRLSNAVHRMGDPSSFPGPGDDVIVQALAWAFQGAETIVVVDESIAAAEAELDAAAADAGVEYLPAEALAGDATDDDIPFGTEES